MREWYRRKTPDERRAWVARRDPEKVRAADRRRYRRDKDKNNARMAVRKAVVAGDLERGPCAVCGVASPDGPKRNQAHHDDYSKPLDIRWLCPRHHNAEHFLGDE